MNAFSQHAMDRPAVYRFKVCGRIKQTWIEAMWGTTFDADDSAATPDQTVFVCQMADQAGLVGCINTLFNLGHAIISIALVEPDDPATAEHA